MKRRLVSGFALAAILVMAIVSLAFWSSSEAVATTRTVAHSYDVIAEIERALSTVIDAETGERGYVITRDEQFLSPYAKAREAAPGSLARLRSLTADNPGQAGRVARMAPLIEAKFAIDETIVALASQRPADTAQIVSATQRGRRITLEMRALTAEMRREEESLLARRISDSRATQQRVSVVHWLLAVAGIGLLGLQYSLIARHLAERMRAENDAREREMLLRSVIEGATDPIFVKDRQGRYTMINSAVATTLGRPRTEVLGRTAHDVFSPESAAYIHNVDMAVMDAGETRTHEDDLVIQGVTRSFLSTRGPLYDAAGRVTGLFGMSREITDRKKAEAALVALNRDLARRTRDVETANKELEAFSYSVSHDLRAPLRHISGFVDLLQKHSAEALDPQGRRYLDTIASSAKHMGELVDDLLVFSRMGRAEFRSSDVDMGALFADVIREMSKDAGEREIDWVVGALPHVRADPAMLRLAVVNLLDNAVKYTRPRKRARIEVGTGPSAGTEHVIFVKDNGVGFDMQYADKLFGVFQRLHRSEDFEGTGIGLANVRRIVQRHGGRTWAEGRVGEGATFYFSLPKEAGAHA